MNDRSAPSTSKLIGRWNQSVGFRFTLSTFLLVVCISVLFVVVEGYLSYQQEVRRLNAQISQIEESHIPSIVSSLWLTDYDLLNRQLEAIERFPHIRQVVIVTSEGYVFQTGEDPAFSGLASEGGNRVLTYTRRDVEIEVGSMWLYIDENELRKAALTPTLVFSVVGHFVLAVIIAGVVSVLFRTQVGRYLEGLAVHAQASTEPDGEEAFELNRRKPYEDELQRLVEAVNTMRRSLMAHLRERELLMREVHHRIKNDLGFVMAFLSVQANQSSSPDAAEALREASQRVSVMANIYNSLFSGSNVQEVDLASVVNDVVRDLQAKNILPAASVDVEVENITASVRFAVSFGTIVNELLTNAAKYASTNGTAPEIVISVCTGESPHTAELKVRDSGGGFPKDVLNGQRLGYGLTIVKALVGQYDGTLVLRNEPGATAIIEL